MSTGDIMCAHGYLASCNICLRRMDVGLPYMNCCCDHSVTDCYVYDNTPKMKPKPTYRDINNMRYYRCKCGKREAWSSMGVPECSGCPECDTTLEEFPDMHRKPEEHVFQEEWRIDKDNGTRWKVRICHRCMKEEKISG